jgi:hypothetical protein
MSLNSGVTHVLDLYRSPVRRRYLVNKCLARTLECFEQEAVRRTRILAIGLHPHLIGVPQRWGDMARMLDLLQSRDDVCFMTGSQIADWFAAQTR